MSSAWKEIRHRAEWMAVKTAAFLLPMLPRPAAQWVGTMVGAVAWFVHLEGRRVALANLECVFGTAMLASRKKQLVRQAYQHFSRAQADLYWSRRLTRENLSAIFEFEGLERLKREHGDRAFIIACMHYGGFEWITLALGLSGFEGTVLAQAFKNPLLTPIINQLREISGHQTVRREGALLRLFKALRTGRSVTIAVDLSVSPTMPSVPITCFGLQTSVTLAHAWLHQRTGAPIIPTHCEPLPDGRYRLVFHPALEVMPNATNQQIVQACWDRFEPVVRRNPAPWLWMYKYWRYLPPNPQRPYPDYANESPHFAKLLARMNKERDDPAAEATAPGLTNRPA
jgi:KDO2-lipid IV(A) lauroyltransferase